MFDLTILWAVIIAVGIFMYVLLDGFDLGVGILFPFAPGEGDRDVMMNSVAPVWDGNETWLILGGAGLLGAFPLVYSVYLPALYIGVFLLLAGLIFRGVAFEFRFKAGERSRRYWNWAFFGGSAVAAFAQGAVVGTFIQGFETEGLVYVGGPLDWLTPFTVLTGLGLMAGYTLLGLTWLILKTEGETQEWAYRLAPRALAVVVALFVLVSLFTPLIDPRAFTRWLETPLMWLLPLGAALAIWRLWRALKNRHEGQPFVATMAIFVFTYGGLLVSKWPYMVPPDHTIWDAASAPESQLFLILGVLFVTPIVIGYSAWTYWVFRGKVRVGEGYH
ncbi:MAG: cytochrome d ubiquinol oxidase subunit II [Pseudomonadota bacterium]